MRVCHLSSIRARFKNSHFTASRRRMPSRSPCLPDRYQSAPTPSGWLNWAGCGLSRPSRRLMWGISSLNANLHRPMQALISSSPKTCNSVFGPSCDCRRRREASNCRVSSSFRISSRVKNPCVRAFFFVNPFPRFALSTFWHCSCSRRV